METNYGIRVAAKAAGVRLWEIATEMGCNDGNFSRKLRHELPEEQKQEILQIIERLAASKEANCNGK